MTKIDEITEDIADFITNSMHRLIDDGYSRYTAAEMISQSYITLSKKDEMIKKIFFKGIANCKQCGRDFVIKGNRKVFCSKECSKYYYNHQSHFRGPDGRNRK